MPCNSSGGGGGKEGRKCIWGKKGNHIWGETGEVYLFRGKKGKVCLGEEEGSLCGSVNGITKKN